jgi:hypothetical protein
MLAAVKITGDQVHLPVSSTSCQRNPPANRQKIVSASNTGVEMLQKVKSKTQG